MKLIDRIKRNFHRWAAIKNADNIIYDYLCVPAIDYRVNLHIHDVKVRGWGYYDKDGSYPHNLGDSLAIPIVEFMLAKKGMSLNSRIDVKKHLLTVGSGGIRGFQNATMWGTGIMYDELHGGWWEKYLDANHRKLDIRAVRGPLSREIFLKLGHDCPEVYGDPGILMPLIYQPQPILPKQDYCIIPQYVTEVEVRRYIPEEKIISMNTDDYKSVIDRICSCQMVYSSSLHGIILAEAYGVPAVFFRGSCIPQAVDFKYMDWYASTGRYNVPMAGSLVEAFATTPPELPDLQKMQLKLMEVFPYDLWD